MAAAVKSSAPVYTARIEATMDAAAAAGWDEYDDGRSARRVILGVNPQRNEQENSLQFPSRLESSEPRKLDILTKSAIVPVPHCLL